MNKQFWDDLDLALEPIRRQATPSTWETNRTVSLSGAGIATAMVLLLAQLKNAHTVVPPSLAVAIWCSSLALPFWLCFWQISEAYLLWGDKAKHHYEHPKVLVSLLFFYLTTCLIMFVGMVAIVWYFLPSAAFALIATSAIVTIFGGRFVGQIAKAAQKN